MTLAEATTSPSLASLEAIFRDLHERLDVLGLRGSIWDARGQCVQRASAAGAACAALLNRAQGCPVWQGRVAGEVLDSGAPARAQTPWGCCVFGLPLRRRRRLLGAVVACCPAVDRLDEENLARACDELELDRTAVLGALRGGARHRADAVEDLQRVVEWMLEGTLALETAQGEINTLSANLATSYEELSLLYSISRSMRVTQQPEPFLRGTCEELLQVLNADALGVVVRARRAAQPPLTVLEGTTSLDRDALRRFVEREVEPRLARAKRPVVENDANGAAESVRNYAAVPLEMDGAGGVLVAMNKCAGDFDSVDLKLMSSIGNQAAVFVTNSRLYADMQDLLMGVLHALTATIDAKDPYTCGHSQRVATLSRMLAQAIGLDAQQVQQVYLAGLLHDIGKIGVPEATLRKAGRLTEAEFEDIKRHPVIGAKILSGIRQLEGVTVGILAHHERLDGRGYPQGVTEVPQMARIIGLADSFDAMTSDRTYRAALPLPAVLAEIRTNAGTQFDPELVEVFLAMDPGAILDEMRSAHSQTLALDIRKELSR